MEKQRNPQTAPEAAVYEVLLAAEEWAIPQYDIDARTASKRVDFYLPLRHCAVEVGAEEPQVFEALRAAGYTLAHVSNRQALHLAPDDLLALVLKQAGPRRREAGAGEAYVHGLEGQQLADALLLLRLCRVTDGYGTSLRALLEQFALATDSLDLPSLGGEALDAMRQLEPIVERLLAVWAMVDAAGEEITQLRAALGQRGGALNVGGGPLSPSDATCKNLHGTI